MNSESIPYSVGNLACRGMLLSDESARPRPLVLMAPNWLGITKANIQVGETLAAQGYTVFMVDMFGEGRGPKGTENPMEFLAPLFSDAGETRRRITAGFDTMVREAAARGLGDSRRAAIGYCFGGHNVLELARAGADAAAVVSVHGVLATPLPARRGDVKAAILVLHGAADPISPKAHRDAFETEMDAAGAFWDMLTFGHVVHNYTDPSADNLPVSKYDEPATRYSYILARAFMEDAFAGKLRRAHS